MYDIVFKHAAEQPAQYRAELLLLGDFLVKNGQYDYVQSVVKSARSRKNNKSYKKWQKLEINRAIESAKAVGLITPSWILWILTKHIVVAFLKDLFFKNN